MKISKIERDVVSEHTWDISTDDETYVLGNGCISHNTSAQISNSTNGIEPPRHLVSYKASKDGVMAQVVPSLHRYRKSYDLLWDQQSPEGYLNICGVLQKFIDQGISVNTSYVPKFFEGGKVPMSHLLQDIFYAYKLGIKQLYYSNTDDGSGDVDDEAPKDLKEDEDEDADEICDSCAI
jgi:ribonucleoside-diphosphate reductase alpha chain